MNGRRWQSTFLLLPFLCSSALAQAPARPQPYCIRGVSLDAAGEKRITLVLRDGTIAAVLDETAPAPPGTRVIEGQGLLCLPTFLDAFTRQGCTVPQPKKDQDLPPDEKADVGIDMRLANRKGIQPAFRAAEALALTKDQTEAWRKAGFGAALVAPGGELLAGSSVLATTREAAMRDVVLREPVFEHGAFAASGPGYPSTLMGYCAQLRQFLLDSERHVELTHRYEAGRPTLRPPFDEEMQEGAELVTGHRRLFCEAQNANDIDRWLHLADEFHLSIGICGGLEAWRVEDTLLRHDVPVVLTLDWGKEVDDPRPKVKPESEEQKPDEPKPDAETAAKEPEAKEAPETSSDDESKAAPEYVEPYPVRLDRRLRWEEGRDCAVRLHEAGVRFLFGTAAGKPEEMIEHVRTVVEHGLPAEAALAALTVDAAAELGVGDRLGRIESGFDATFTLWRADPLRDEKATVAWIFVDGFPTKFEPPKEKEAKGKPAEGVNPTGTWEVEFADSEGPRSATLVLEMDESGKVEGTLSVENPMDGSQVEAKVEGSVSEHRLELETTLVFGEMRIQGTFEGRLDGDSLEGEASFRGAWGDETMTREYEAKRKPEGGVR